jgi:branched-subunit amino acid transport protein
MWFAIIASAGIAFTMRISLLLLAGGRELHPSVDRALAAVGPAVIAAMLTSSLLRINDGQRADIGQLLAVGIALGVVVKTGNVLFGTAAGLTALVVAGWLGSAGL